MYPLPPGFCMLVEVLNLVHSCLIVCQAIWGGFNNPRGREVGVSVPGGKVVFALYDQERRQCKAVAAYALDRCRPFPIARLKLLASSASISTRNDHVAADNAHHEAHLIKVIEVFVLDRILHAHVGYQPEPRVYKLRVFAEGSLEVVGA